MSCFPLPIRPYESALHGLSNSREQEAEADHIGLLLIARAGYEPRAGID